MRPWKPLPTFHRILGVLKLAGTIVVRALLIQQFLLLLRLVRSHLPAFLRLQILRALHTKTPVAFLLLGKS